MVAQPPKKPRVRKIRPVTGTSPVTATSQPTSQGSAGGNQPPPPQGGGNTPPPQLPLDQRVTQFLVGLFPRLSSLYTYLWVGLLAILALHVLAAIVSGWGEIGKLLMLVIELGIFLAVAFVWFHPFLMAAEIATVTGEAIIDPATEVGKNIVTVVKKSASAFLGIGIAGVIVPATVMMIFNVSLNIFESIGLLILGIFAGLLAWRVNPEGDLVLRLTLAALVGAIVKILAGKVPMEAYGATDIAHYAGWIGMFLGFITFFGWNSLKSTTTEGVKLLHPKRVLIFLGGLFALLAIVLGVLVFIAPNIPAKVVNTAFDNAKKFGNAVGSDKKPAAPVTPTPAIPAIDNTKAVGGVLGDKPLKKEVAPTKKKLVVVAEGDYSPGNGPLVIKNDAKVGEEYALEVSGQYNKISYPTPDKLPRITTVDPNGNEITTTGVPLYVDGGYPLVAKDNGTKESRILAAVVVNYTTEQKECEYEFAGSDHHFTARGSKITVAINSGCEFGGTKNPVNNPSGTHHDAVGSLHYVLKKLQ